MEDVALVGLVGGKGGPNGVSAGELILSFTIERAGPASCLSSTVELAPVGRGMASHPGFEGMTCLCP